jgi:hypothetical protein
MAVGTPKRLEDLMDEGMYAPIFLLSLMVLIFGSGRCSGH